ncbi:hypothetical protein [Arthrobacter sp. HY1533]|uniref:hypothetical protein n=1 Tax=Arthrobacter sp. HY1533 TaxID=2970919 RepID=UPI0022BA0C0C|nr:hypothetical protein [Arthrobacter sp. HY1533]
MYGAQPTEYDDPYYGDGRADYSHETGHNEFPYYPGIYELNGKTPDPPEPAPRKHGAHAKRNLRRVEQDRAAALEAERAEIMYAMANLTIFAGYRAVVFELTDAFQPELRG